MCLLSCAIAYGEAEEDAALRAEPGRVAAWQGGRLGLFIHWGPWSQTGIGYIWRMMESPGEEARGMELWRTFDPVNFNPGAWARAAKDAGMSYVVFVTKHHDGFNLYDTGLSNYRITARGAPFAGDSRADITRAIIDAFRAEGLAIGLYFSHIDWHHADGRRFSRGHRDFDPSLVDRDPAAWRRFADYEIGQVRELLTQYGKIDIVWFDIQWPFAENGIVRVSHPVVRADVLRLVRMIRELQPEALINDRGTDVYGDFLTPEQRVPETGLPGPWETSLTITNERGYWYKGDGVSCKSPDTLVRTLVDVASKGGNLLLNVAPRPDGTLIPGEYEALAGLGRWMRKNGESIRGTLAGPFLDLPWGRSTWRGTRVYLHVLDWPRDGVLSLPGLRSPIVRAWLLADPGQVPLEVLSRDGEAAIAVVPRPAAEGVSVIAVDFESVPVVRNLLRASEGGRVLLPVARARLNGSSLRYNHGRNILRGGFLEGFATPGESVSWDFAVSQPGRYRVSLEYALSEGPEGGTFQVVVDGSGPLTAEARATAKWDGPLLEVRTNTPEQGETKDNRWTFGSHAIGTVSIPQAGENHLEVRAIAVSHGNLFFLKGVTLEPL